MSWTVDELLFDSPRRRKEILLSHTASRSVQPPPGRPEKCKRPGHPNNLGSLKTDIL